MKNLYSFIQLLSFLITLLISKNAQAQFGSDIGAPAISTLTWDHIASDRENFTSPAVGSAASMDGSSIGLTTNKKIYVWGSNCGFSIHTGYTMNGTFIYRKYQTTPRFVPSPAGETVKKVDIISAKGGPMFFCLTESGKLYAWGVNGQFQSSARGLLSTAEYGTSPAWPLVDSEQSDSTMSVRAPRLLNVAGQSVIVDFDVATNTGSPMCIAISATGDAYFIGSDESTTFTAIPKPAGVDGTFKYTRVWLSAYEGGVGYKKAFLKGSDGKIYYTGRMNGQFNTGVPSLYNNTTVTTTETNGTITTITPREAPLPAGEDITNIRFDATSKFSAVFAISASGKAFMAGGWRRVNKDNPPYTYTTVPLKTAPVVNTELDLFTSATFSFDTIYLLKKFVEVAMPPGATKILDMYPHSWVDNYPSNSLVVGDNNKVYWSGRLVDSQRPELIPGNFLEPVRDPAYGFYDQCKDIVYSKTSSLYSWTHEAINYRGTAKFITIDERHDAATGNLGFITKSGRGYYVGAKASYTGAGKILSEGSALWGLMFPTPIANELLETCNTNPGTGGENITTPNSATGT
ncbi:hypothetical protein, partial [Arsenicibacter rosenii]|uniref:hypothetical protein n=1 Tax=Arsenicibacter rosenii TaxID=1750698 RepID=UPI0011604319